MTRAPPIEPIAITETIAAYVVALPSKLNLASSGRTTWKLKPSVPTSAISASGISSAGVSRT